MKEALNKAFNITPNVILKLPRNMVMDSVLSDITQCFTESKQMLKANSLKILIVEIKSKNQKN